MHGVWGGERARLEPPFTPRSLSRSAPCTALAHRFPSPAAPPATRQPDCLGCSRPTQCVPPAPPDQHQCRRAAGRLGGGGGVGGRVAGWGGAGEEGWRGAGQHVSGGGGGSAAHPRPPTPCTPVLKRRSGTTSPLALRANASCAREGWGVGVCMRGWRPTTWGAPALCPTRKHPYPPTSQTPTPPTPHTHTPH